MMSRGTHEDLWGNKEGIFKSDRKDQRGLAQESQEWAENCQGDKRKGVLGRGDHIQDSKL